MKCKYLKLLNRYADNELKLNERDILGAHILNCQDCAKELKLIQALKKGVVNNRIDSNQEFFWQELKSKITLKQTADKEEIFTLDFTKFARKLIPIPVVVGVIAAIWLSVSVSTTNENLIDRYLFDNVNGGISNITEELPGDYSGVSILLN